MTRRLAHGHSLGAGLVLGLLAAGKPLWIFGAGVVVGILLVFVARLVRRAVRGGKVAARVLTRAAATEQEGARGRELPPAELDGLERERERRIGLRQGEAAGIRAAARVERREQARRDAMSSALEEHWQAQRRRDLERVVGAGQ